MTVNCWVPFVFLIGRQSIPFLTTPHGDLKKTSRTEKVTGNAGLLEAISDSSKSVSLAGSNVPSREGAGVAGEGRGASVVCHAGLVLANDRASPGG